MAPIQSITTTTNLFLMELVHRSSFTLLVWTHSSASHMTTVLQSTFSSSRRCWFTTVTCTQDISSPTAAAPPHLAALHPSAASGYGCQTIRYAKPTCTRCCLPTLTCSFTREYEGLASLCPQSLNDFCLSSHTVTLDVAGDSTVTNRWLCEHDTREESHPRVVLGCSVMCCGHLACCSAPEEEPFNPKDNETAGFLSYLLSVSYFFFDM